MVYGFDDGFGSARRVEGKYFTVYYASQVDPAELSQKLNIGVEDRVLTGGSTEKWGSDYAGGSADSLADMVDTLFLRVSDILDMHIYSFHGNIKVCRNEAQLSNLYKEFFGREPENHTLFVADLNTIYTSPDNFTKEVLGHEIAHAIMSRYFVVQPPIKVAEVLAGYVEYQLRKKK
ncbi:MAG: hypothetical protein WC532_06490 [Candidatus Omnitrophota bacterium]